MSQLSTRRATIEDVALLADIGARTFVEAFAVDNRPEDIEQYVKQAFAPEQIAAEASEQGGRKGPRRS